MSELLRAEVAALKEAGASAEQRAVRAQERADVATRALEEALRRADRAEADRGVTDGALRSFESLIDAQLSQTAKLEAAIKAAAEWDAQLAVRERAALMKIQEAADDLVRAAARLPEFVASADLRDELAALRGEDPREVLRALDVLLSEALGSAPHVRDLREATPAQLREALAHLEGVVERHRAAVAVAPAADGTVDGRFGKRPVESVTVRDSVGVVRGDDSTVTVIHQCEVAEPVVEMAELLKMEPEGPLFGWSGTALRPGTVTGTSTSVSSNALAIDFWTNIWSSSGVAVGDNITMEVARRHTIEGCRVNLAALLADAALRDDLALSRGDTAEAQAARERLPHTVERVLRDLDVGDLVSTADVARQASVGNRPQVRQSGARLTVVHGAGVGIGRNPTASARTRIRIADPRVS
ncbi:hypothetical protein [Asanoa hainanensis]|uniref:hypothetical protein n=1 Tax=Asanoa hainanensis TaxID=560556 RepID=UPI0011813665|nr:hypothetical protein [Asanoa hainanensis]